MSVTYKKSQILLGPLIFIKNNHEVQYGEIVNIKIKNGTEKVGQVVKITEDYIIIEAFQETTGLSPNDTEIKFTKDSFKIKISDDMIGKTFNSLGKPIDVYSRSILDLNFLSNIERYIEGEPINPFARDYPSEIIQTGISAIDGLFTLVMGQKLPIFSGQGLPHNKLAAQIITQSRPLSGSPLLSIFCGIGMVQDDVIYFFQRFQESGAMQNIISFINYADDPILERLIIPRAALPTAEYFAFEKNMNVLVLLVNMTNYAEALRELSAAKEEVPSRKGFPGYMYSDFASIYERAGKLKTKSGSITQIPIIIMPNDDITHPIPDTTGYITEGQIVLDRNLHKKGIYPPIDVLSSISRLMKDSIGKNTTRADHADLSSHLISSYSNALEIRELISIIGVDALGINQKPYLKFGKDFEEFFINQEINENISLNKTFDNGWKLLSNLPKTDLFRIHQEFLDKYYTKEE